MMLSSVLCSLVLSGLALLFSIWSLIGTEALKRSTHQVTFLDPTKQSFEAFNEDLKKELQKSNPKDFEPIM